MAFPLDFPMKNFVPDPPAAAPRVLQRRDWIAAPRPTRRVSPGRDTPQPGRDTWDLPPHEINYHGKTIEKPQQLPLKKNHLEI